MNPPPPPPPPPLQPPRSSFSCDRHPHENFTGFCPSCLCERLTILDPSSSSTSSAIKSTFRDKITTRTSFLSELRRTKSFSASKNEALGCVFEPQRKSCDVRGRNTLWSLFSIDDDDNPTRQQTLGSTGTVLETNKEDDEEDLVHNDEIRVSEEQDVSKLNDLENDIVEMEAQVDAIVDNLKTMKDHIDLDAQSKKPSLSSFWSAASVLNKKWHKWRQKQKKSPVGSNGVVSSFTLPAHKPISRKCRETQSEVADYGFGRRSCDIDPRFSLDAGRVWFDEPRASCDGHFIGRSFPRLPPMVENVSRSDMQIPVEEPANVPGGSTQTREYYLDSSSKRRKSLDRSNSIRKMAAEMDERKTNAKVSPVTIDYNHSHGRLKFPSIGAERELTFRDNCSEAFDKDPSRDIGEVNKKSRWWSWKIWRGNNKDLNREQNGFNRKVCRSNSSVSWRNSENGNNRRQGDDFVFERNGSARSSSNNINNGLLRFYLTPLRGSRRGGIGIGTGKNKHYIARNMLPIY